MATLTYTFVSRCGRVGHFVVDISFNGGASRRVVYTTDEVRAPLSELNQEQRETLALYIMKLHMAGKSRAQIASEFQAGPVEVTI